MNQAGKDRATQLAQREYSPIEYRNRLVRMQNMDCICHCSAEIDKGTLLYFSVNDMYLGKGAFVLLLFSEISSPSPEQEAGLDVFGRMYTYAIIKEVADEAFNGHYSFYSSELDGRLVLILNFPYGLLPDRSIVDYLDVGCREISARCRQRYGLDVVSYISEPIINARQITAIYTRLLETATLHRYLKRRFDDPAVHVAQPDAFPGANNLPSLHSGARELVSTLLGGGDYIACADRLLHIFSQEQAVNISNLKHMFGSYFDYLCREFVQMGIKIKEKALRAEGMRILFDSETWDEPMDWLHGVLDSIGRDYSETAQKAARARLDAALRYIDEHFTDPGITMEVCAAQAGCSVSALVKQFRRQMQSPVGKYIRAKRLELALRLLKEGCTVGETCEKCGFGSLESFHRAFKAEYGVTPGQMRGADLQREPVAKL